MLELRTKILLLGCFALSSASELEDNHRRLTSIGDETSGLQIAGYTPRQSVLDVARIDLDQKDIRQALSFNSFTNARDAYENGGHSFSVATITLDTPLPSEMSAKSIVLATTQSGQQLRASLWKDASLRASTIDVLYSNEDSLCQVGGAINPITEGCKYLPSLYVHFI
jgi:hypothetical protein